MADRDAAHFADNRQHHSAPRIAVVGEYDPTYPPHQATDAAVRHAAGGATLGVTAAWISTNDIGADAHAVLGAYAGIWIAPGSPYRNLEGALRAIQYARESDVPLLGTCGGFQHVVLEFARSVMGIADGAHAEYDPYASRLFITPLSCSLAGQTMTVTLEPGSRTAECYGAHQAIEQYYCNFGLNPDYGAALDAAGLRIVGRDADREARVVELPEHRFFVATLFVPQLSSTAARPHPLVMAFVRAALRAARNRHAS